MRCASAATAWEASIASSARSASSKRACLPSMSAYKQPNGPCAIISGATRQLRCSDGSAPSGPWRSRLAPPAMASFSQRATACSNASAPSPAGNFDAAMRGAAWLGCITSSTRCAPSSRAASLTMAACSAASAFSLPRRSGNCASRSSREGSGGRVLFDLVSIAAFMGGALHRFETPVVLDDLQGPSGNQLEALKASRAMDGCDGLPSNVY